MNVHHEEKCRVVKLFIFKPFSVTCAWLTQSEGQGQGQHLLLRHTQQPAPGSRSCSGTWQLRDTSGAGQWRGSAWGEHHAGGTTSGQQTSVHLHPRGRLCPHTHPSWNPGEYSANSLLSLCIYSMDHRVCVHDPVQEPLRVVFPLLTSLSQSMALNPLFVLEVEPLENPQATALPKVAEAKFKSLLTDYFSVYFQLASQKPGNPPANLSYT